MRRGGRGGRGGRRGRQMRHEGEPDDPVVLALGEELWVAGEDVMAELGVEEADHLVETLGGGGGGSGGECAEEGYLRVGEGRELGGELGVAGDDVVAEADRLVETLGGGGRRFRSDRRR
ncbi:hypothetical protein HID58_033837 [Brassica napus]|uniref:Uncharacterized protein n=1 Tax=Brassica napus TaxID=3708 RepID=A0ABQ8C0D5_BRANA|nr:hypothetical protein HID58_033837 [Brassica napus]